MGSDPPLRFLTAKLEVDYLAPTPLGVELEASELPVGIPEDPECRDEGQEHQNQQSYLQASRTDVGHADLLDGAGPRSLPIAFAPGAFSN